MLWRRGLYANKGICSLWCPSIMFVLIVIVVTDQSATEADGEILEGVLNRKHEWESTTKKASNR